MTAMTLYEARCEMAESAHTIVARAVRLAHGPMLSPAWQVITETIGDAEFDGVDMAAVVEMAEAGDLAGVADWVSSELGYPCYRCDEGGTVTGGEPLDVCAACTEAADDDDGAHERDHAAGRV